METPTVSIIIPIYRVEAYLAQCIDSVLAQTYRDLEVILVDDGSPDGCGAICDAYAARDGRVKVIHKENGGLGDARNAGLALASGEYVVFLDGDDFWADSAALGRIVDRARARGADVLNYGYTKFWEDSGRHQSYFGPVEAMPQLPDIREQLNWMTTRGLYIASACNKLIRRSLITDLPFPKGVYCEDIAWCAKLLGKAAFVDFIPEDFYQYRQRPGSIRHSVSGKFCQDLTEAILECLDLAESAPPNLREPLLRYAAFQFGTFLLNQAKADTPQSGCIARLKAHASILRHHADNKKLMVLHWFCCLTGLEMMCGLIRIGYRRIHG